MPKIIFTTTLVKTGWATAAIADKPLTEIVQELKLLQGNDVFIGSPGLIAQLTNLKLIDEYQICFHPVVAGNGLTLFRNLEEMMRLKLLRTKQFGSGAVVMYYGKET